MVGPGQPIYDPNVPMQPVYDPALAYPGTQFPPQPNVPMQVYYPPPPRQPLLKPEHKMLLGRVFLVVLMLGTIFLLFAVGFMYYTGTWAPSGAKNGVNRSTSGELNGSGQPVANGPTGKSR